MSNVLLINGSPNKGGSTFTALSEVAKVLNDNGVNTYILYLGKKAMPGCIDCGKCKELKKCVFNDEVNNILEHLDEIDAIIVGSPVYFAGPTGQICSFLDRLFHVGSNKMKGKLAAAVVTCRRGGASAAFDRLNKYFSIANMHIIGSQYWNQVHGNNPDEIKKDLEGLQTMRTLALNMVWLLKNIEAGKAEGISIPQYENKIYTNFIEE